MKNIKCQNCGAKLKVNRVTGMYVCESCGSEFLIEQDNNENNNYLVAGLNLLELKEFKKASDSFDKACEMFPNNANCWFGKLRAVTRDMTDISEKNIKDVEKYLSHIEQTSTEEERKEFGGMIEKLKANMQIIYNEREKVKKGNKFGNILFATLIITFIALFVINLVFTIISKSYLLWKVVGLILLSALDFGVLCILSIGLSKLNPSKKWHYILISILTVVIIAIIIYLDIIIAKTI